jgi:hypothetical protein
MLTFKLKLVLKNSITININFNFKLKIVLKNIIDIRGIIISVLKKFDLYSDVAFIVMLFL